MTARTAFIAAVAALAALFCASAPPLAAEDQAAPIPEGKAAWEEAEKLISSADLARLDEMKRFIAEHILAKNREAGARMLEMALAAEKRLSESAGPSQTLRNQGRSTLILDGSLAFRQLSTRTDPVSRLAAGAPTMEEAKALAIEAFEGPSGHGGKPLDGTPKPPSVFSIKGIHDASTHFPGRPDPLRKPPPPPPTKVHSPQSTGRDVAEKGVRIEFDAVALRSALSSSESVEEMEESLAAVRDVAGIEKVIAAVERRMISRFFGEERSSAAVRMVRVSIRDLCAASGAYRDRWKSLPVELRRPGSLRRIIGMVVVRETRDVVLLGTGEGPGESVDIDDLAVGFRAGWRDGSCPVCSIDPDPSMPGGIQRTVIQGIPPDSNFARTMLEADYDMKACILGTRGVRTAGFTDLRALMAEELESSVKSGSLERIEFKSRFWFTPAIPSPGSILVSRDGGIVVFRAGMRLLSEDMISQGGLLTGTGRAGKVAVRQAESFTMNLDSLEQEVASLRKLHALFDIMLAASICRLLGLDFECLGSLAGLPTLDASVPAAYPALQALIEVNGTRIGSLSGGVELHAPLGGHSLLRADLPEMRELLERIRGSDGPAAGVEASIPLARAADSSSAAESGLLEAARCVWSGMPDRAAVLLSEIIRRNPGNSEALRLRAEARAMLGRWRLADSDALAAESLGGGDPLFRLMRIRFLIERGTVADPGALDGGIRNRLADHYLLLAGRNAASGSPELALAAARRASSLRPGDRKPRALAAELLYATGKNEAVLEEIESAVRAAGDDARLQILKARALMGLGRSKPALEAASKALELEPGSLEALVARASIRMAVESWDTGPALSDLNSALEKNPNHPEALIMKARILALEGDRSGPAALCDRVIRSSPAMAGAYELRALLCAESDSIARGGSPPRGAALEAVSRSLLDCNTAILLNPALWRARIRRAEILCAAAQSAAAFVSSESFAARIIEAMASQASRVKVSFADLQVQNPDVLLRRIARLCLEISVADLETARASSPAGAIPGIEEFERSCKDALKRGD